MHRRVAASTGVQSVRVSLPPGKYARTLSPSSPIPIDKTVVASDSSMFTPRSLLGTLVSPPTTQHATSEQPEATPYHTIVVPPLVEPPPDLITLADSTLPIRRAILDDVVGPIVEIIHCISYLPSRGLNPTTTTWEMVPSVISRTMRCGIPS